MNEQPPKQEVRQGKAKKISLRVILNATIVLLLLVGGYFSYAFVRKTTQDSSSVPVEGKKTRIVQLDVLNGCGTKGAGSKCTSYLRATGFDVVEMKNYKTFNVPRTLVVDRVGDLAVARRVAASLGVSEQNIIQQINPDYFVDVSVIIGADFASLRALK